MAAYRHVTVVTHLSPSPSFAKCLYIIRCFPTDNQEAVEALLLSWIKLPLNNQQNGPVEAVYVKHTAGYYQCLWAPSEPKQRSRQQTQQAGHVFPGMFRHPAIAAAVLSGGCEVHWCADEEAAAAEAAEEATRKPLSEGAQTERKVKKLVDAPAAKKLLHIVDKLKCGPLKEITGCSATDVKQKRKVGKVGLMD